MLRHRLASFFEPKSLLVITDIELPILKALPASFAAHTTVIHIQEGQSISTVLADSPLSESKELALICVQPSHLSAVLAYLSARPPQALLLLPPNVIDMEPKESAALLSQWVKDNKVMLLGARSFGVQRPHLNLNLSRSENAKAGRVAVVSQSRMLAMSVLDWALDTHIGLSAIVSLGETVNVDIPEIIEYLAGDARTDSIVLYLDKFSSGRELISAIRTAASVKPVVVLRAGRTDKVLMGSDQVFDAALRRSGAVRVHYFVDMFSSLKALTHKRRPKGGRVAVIANGRAQAQLLMDEMLSCNHNMQQADFSQETRTKLMDLLGPGCLVGNPVIAYEPITGDKLVESLKILQDDNNVDALMVVLAPDDATDMEKVVDHLVQFVPRAKKPILNTLLGEYSMKPLRRVIDQSGSPAFRTPETAISGMGALISYHYNQQLLQQTRIPFFDTATPDKQSGINLINGLRAEGRRELTKAEGYQLLKFYHADIYLGADDKDEQYSVEDDIPALKVMVKRDPVFGPWIYFGEGGHEVKVPVDDQGLDLPPLNAYLARLGWSHGDDEIFTREQIIEWFDGNHMSKSAAQWDPKKLNWVNAHYIKQLDDESLAAAVAPRIQARGGDTSIVDLKAVLALFKERAETLEQLADEAMLFCSPFKAADSELLAQFVTPEARLLVNDFAQAADNLTQWTSEELTRIIKETLAKHNAKMPALGIPLRLLVTGQKQTPAVDQVLAIMGKETVLSRLKA